MEIPECNDAADFKALDGHYAYDRLQAALAIALVHEHESAQLT
jgi:hypothetical protein